MKRHKATGIVFIRRYFQYHRELDETNFVKSLSMEDQATYKLCVFNQWIPLSQSIRIFEKAAAVIFPDNENRIEKLSALHAQDSANGVYKMLFRYLAPAFILKQVVRVWKVYNDHGKPSMICNDKKKTVKFLLEDFPEMTKVRQKMITGYMQGFISLTETKFKLTFDGSNSDCWIWEADYSNKK